MFACNLLTCCN